MSLFDPNPKSDARDLYGRESELNALVNDLKNKRWVVLLGPRRVGKTSLAQCAAKELGVKTVFVDARTEPNLLNSLIKAVSPRPSPSVSVGLGSPFLPVSGSVSFNRPDQVRSLDYAIGKKDRLLIIVDEAERLKNLRGVTSILAHLYDYFYDRVTFLITGSAVGVLNAIVDPTSKSPLFGRAMVHTDLKKWLDPTTSINFLREGCKQAKTEYQDVDLVNAVRRLDGLPGWLTSFGFYYSRNGDYGRAIRSTMTSARKIVADELEHTGELAYGWERQKRILQMISIEPLTFTEIRNAMKINNTALSKNLDMLLRLQYVERDGDGRYRVTDPVVGEYFGKLMEGSERRPSRSFGNNRNYRSRF